MPGGIIPIAGAPRHSAQNIAFHEVGRQSVMADPEWHSARAKTEENGPIVAKVTNYILGPTPYSSVK